ncbi:MAG: trypsin-like serine protease [Pseudomonadota bacterium]|nr:trypsin-like serine protease [Pseudomonadota bacterium]
MMYEPRDAWGRDLTTLADDGPARIDVVLDVSMSVQLGTFDWYSEVNTAVLQLLADKRDDRRVELRILTLPDLAAAAKGDGDEAIALDAEPAVPLAGLATAIDHRVTQPLAAAGTTVTYTPLSASLERLLADDFPRGRYLLLFTDGWDCTPPANGDSATCMEGVDPRHAARAAELIAALQRTYRGGVSVWLYRAKANAKIVHLIAPGSKGWEPVRCGESPDACLAGARTTRPFQRLRARYPPPAKDKMPPEARPVLVPAFTTGNAGGGVADLRPVEAERFGTTAALGQEGQWHCSGVLVGAGVVLTARHCLPAAKVTFAMRVDERARIYAVVEAREHPDPAVDAALVRLDADPLLEPEPLRRAVETQPPIGTVRAAGYGAVDRGGAEGSGQRHITDLPAMGWGCNGSRASLLGCAPDWEMVLRSASRDTCNGDSGGPVFEPWVGSAEAAHAVHLDPNERLCGWRLLAITSRPVAISRVACGDGGIYTRVDRLQPWLDDTIHALELR